MPVLHGIQLATLISGRNGSAARQVPWRASGSSRKYPLRVKALDSCVARPPSRCWRTTGRASGSVRSVASAAVSLGLAGRLARDGARRARTPCPARGRRFARRPFPTGAFSLAILGSPLIARTQTRGDGLEKYSVASPQRGVLQSPRSILVSPKLLETLDFPALRRVVLCGFCAGG